MLGFDVHFFPTQQVEAAGHDDARADPGDAVRQHAPQRQIQAHAQTRAEYSNGAISDASPRRKASVSATCASVPVVPTPRMIHKSPDCSGSHCGAASTPAPADSSTTNHSTIAWMLSRWASRRTVMAPAA